VSDPASDPRIACNPAIARLQAQNLAAIDSGDWDDAADALRTLNELRRGGGTSGDRPGAAQTTPGRDSRD